MSKAAGNEREGFASRIGFILVSAGCAIGIGNVWKFPYIAGENGGAVFVLFYLLFLVIMGMSDKLKPYFRFVLPVLVLIILIGGLLP